MCDGCHVIHVCWNTVRGYESAMEPNSKKNLQIRSGHMLRLSRPHSNPSNMSVAGSTSNQSLSKLGLWMAERKQQRSVSWEVWDFPLRPGFLRELWLLRQAAGLNCANWSLVVVWPAMVPFGVSPVSQCESVTSHDIPQLSTTIHNYPQLSTTIHNYPQVSTTIHNYPQLSTSIHNYPQVLFIFCRFLSFLWHFYALEAIKCIPCIKPQIAPEVGWHWTKKALASWVPWVAKVWKNHVFQCSVFSHQTLHDVAKVGSRERFLLHLCGRPRIHCSSHRTSWGNCRTQWRFFLGETSWCCHCHLWLPEGKFCDLCFTNSNPISVYVFPEYGDPFPSKFQWTFSGGHPELKNGCYVCKHSLQ